MARRAGLRTIIWERQIWIAGAGWAPYLRDPHTDHVHFGFGWAGARGETSFYHRSEAGALRVVPFCPGFASGGLGDLDEPAQLADDDHDVPSEPPDIYEQIDREG